MVADACKEFLNRKFGKNLFWDALQNCKAVVLEAMEVAIPKSEEGW